MPIPSTLLFLPGASGDTDFWRPLADRLEATAGREILAYPGFGGEPADPSIRESTTCWSACWHASKAPPR